MADLSNLSDADIQQLLDLGNTTGKEGLLQQQMKQAGMLRNAPMPQGRDSGRVYTHANPLEALGNVAEKAMGAYQMHNINDQYAGLMQQQTAGRKKYFDILRQQLANQQQTPAAAVPNPVSPAPDDDYGH